MQNQDLRNLLWIEELLPNDVVSKRMHGGIGYYLDEKLVLILVEASRSRDYKGRNYPFEIWNGCLFPVVPIKQTVVWSKFNSLENHPASKNWLYLPADTEAFEEEITNLVKELKKRNPLFGIILKPGQTSGPVEVEFDMTQPSLFNTGPLRPVKSVEKPKSAPKKIKANKKPGNAHVLALLKGRKK